MVFELIKANEFVSKMYTLHGFVGDPSSNYTRYIQRSWYTGRPIIQSRFGYCAGNVVCFKSEKQAYDFIEKFMTDPDRKNKHDINWKVIRYKPLSNQSKISFKEKESKYGEYYTLH